MKRILYFALALATVCALSSCSVLEDNMAALGVIGYADGPTEIIVTEPVEPAAPEPEEIAPIIHDIADVSGAHATEDIVPAWSALNIPKSASTIGMGWVSYHADGQTLAEGGLDGRALLTNWFGQAYCDTVYQNVATELPISGSLVGAGDIYYIVPQTYGTTLLAQIGDNEYDRLAQPFYFVAGEGAKLFTADADGNPAQDITPTTNAQGTTVLTAGIENLSAYIAVETPTQTDTKQYLPASVYAFAGDDEDLALAFCQSAFALATEQVTALYPEDTPPSVILSTEYYTFSTRTMGFEVQAYVGDSMDTYRVYAQLPAENTDYVGMTADTFQSPYTITKLVKVLEFVPSYEDIALAKTYAAHIGGDEAVQFWNGMRYLATTQGQTTLTPLQVRDYSILLTASYTIPALPDGEVTDAEGNVLLPEIPMDDAGCYQIPMTSPLGVTPTVADFNFPAGLMTLTVELEDATYIVELSRQMDSINSWTVLEATDVNATNA